MPPDRFDTSKPFITLGVLLLIWFLIPTVAKRVSRIGFYELQAPVEVSASYLRELQDYWAWRTRSKTDIYNAYRDLGNMAAHYAHARRREWRAKTRGGETRNAAPAAFIYRLSLRARSSSQP